MKKFMALLTFVFPLSASAQTIDFAVEAVDFFSDVKVEIVDFFADEKWEVVGACRNSPNIKIEFADRKICITNANELDEDLLRSLNLID